MGNVKVVFSTILGNIKRKYSFKKAKNEEGRIMKEIYMSQIKKIFEMYMDIFEQEDSDYPDYRIIRPKERAIDRTLDKITDNKEEQRKIYYAIIGHLFNRGDGTYRPICDDLIALGYTVVEGR